MPDLRAAARRALAERLRELAPPGGLHPEGTHAAALDGALLPTLSAADVAWVHESLSRRAKGELRAAKAGTVQAHAAWSSTALVASAFAAWRERPADLPLLGLGPFTALRLEERLLIPHGGGTPNLDAGQLVRHALSLRGAGDLVYLYWEPLDPEDHLPLRRHRAEVAELLERVRGARPGLHACSWAGLWATWEAAAPHHAAALRERYGVTLTG